MATAGSTRPLRSWVLGGTLLIASAVVGMVPLLASTFDALGWRITAALLFAAATVVFALGLPGGGSITRRRPLESTALIATGFLAVFGALPWTFDNGSLVAIQTMAYIRIAVELIAVIITVTAVARSGSVPAPWNWAPLWALIAIAAPQVLLQAVAVANPTVSQPTLIGISTLGVIMSVCAPIFVGVVAIALAQRPAQREPVEIL